MNYYYKKISQLFLNTVKKYKYIYIYIYIYIDNIERNRFLA